MAQAQAQRRRNGNIRNGNGNGSQCKENDLLLLLRERSEGQGHHHVHRLNLTSSLNKGNNAKATIVTVLALAMAILLLLFYSFSTSTSTSTRITSPSTTGTAYEALSVSVSPDSDAVINLDHGDPTMFEPFWKNAGDKATVVIPGWHTMSYFSDTSNLCWFLEPDFANQVRRLHRIVGNAVTHAHHIIVGVGSTQLIHALLFALSATATGHPVSVVSAAPFYSMYPGITDFLKSGLFRWAGDATSFKVNGSSSFIEIVCSPNNPDGTLRRAVLSTEAGKLVHDLAYYWPQYTPMRGPADEDIMLFTVSKATGHAGTRIGWALVRDADVARRMVKFIEMNSIGVSKDSQVRAARILQVISDGYELPDPDSTTSFFHFSRRLLADRWQRLRRAVEESGRFSLPQFSSKFCEFTKEHTETYPAFAWLRCDDESIEDCEGFFKSMKVLTRSGRHFGAGPEYIRISMLDRAHNFDLFVERIASLGLR
ncbi:Tryptophan aminotransferase-related protein 2 [Rhynchospora pubera]|uniref:Tryptophan aminotransferase-related protein 2 n=1 Tax=Rhynchospora pubera TaxID=906938 RepID=A0AAV8FJT5_9POAL|nr:Tryptophan aminotransferase-related protein 2 [Rhynchospora pubera]